ncbi:MAG TPA: helix-turn-helix domain-containing protein [Mucilaginibacter sp.]|nr:helix-turn-helix domain-containing protein [Mucilaginibacter sp.]
MKNIPLHKIRDRVDTGFEIYYTNAEKLRRKGDQLGIHRDDHYIFFFIETGTATIEVDFTDIMMPPKSVYYILPGQVHRRLNENDASGWFLAIDASLISNEFREVFEDHLVLQKPNLLEDNRHEQCYQLLRLLNDIHKTDAQAPFYLQTAHSLINTFSGIVAGAYSSGCCTEKSSTRPKQIAQDFKRILSENFTTDKSPSSYAKKLNISGSYLNEALNKVTGRPVTYWITHEVMLEAKRLLYYTQLTVKEIAHRLGYDDHTYFSRLFKNTEGKTPLEFREGYHK